MALVGGVVGLWATGQNLSVPASVGFIALFGIALLNGIVLVTYLNQLIREGLPMDEASVQGACLRLRPVLMTAFAAALGMIPSFPIRRPAKRSGPADPVSTLDGEPLVDRWDDHFLWTT